MKNKKLTDEFFKKYENYEKETTEDFIKKHSSTEDALIEGNNRLTYIQHGEMIRDIELDRLEKESEELIETLHDIDREQLLSNYKRVWSVRGGRPVSFHYSTTRKKPHLPHPIRTQNERNPDGICKLRSHPSQVHAYTCARLAPEILE